MKAFISKYKHGFVLLYGIVYMIWFTYLEKHITADFHVIHMGIDDYIPFVEYFIVPYMLWFGFIAVTVLYFFLTDVKDYYRLTIFMFTGMTIFLIISSVFPNGQLLRPLVFPRDNIFTDLVKHLYMIDTPTNILPSIHVYNSLAAWIAISHSEKLKKKPVIQTGSLILTVLIIMSTVFLKQHSMLDVLAAMAMAAVMYAIVYRPGLVSQREKEKVKLEHQLS